MKNRPTSPHLSIYRWQITSVLSILHRITGVALFCILLCCALIIGFIGEQTTLSNNGINNVIAMFSDEMCDCIIIKTIISAMIFGIFFSLFYHIYNGFRYFAWSFVKGLDLKTVTITAYLVLIMATVSSFLAIYILLFS